MCGGVILELMAVRKSSFLRQIGEASDEAYAEGRRAGVWSSVGLPPPAYWPGEPPAPPAGEARSEEFGKRVLSAVDAVHLAGLSHRVEELERRAGFLEGSLASAGRAFEELLKHDADHLRRIGALEAGLDRVAANPSSRGAEREGEPSSLQDAVIEAARRLAAECNSPARLSWGPVRKLVEAVNALADGQARP
jgi:hypothetical protein